MNYDDAPIGVFDSGFGGLTVAREIIKALPEESVLFYGDRAHCPYGPRDPHEVRKFVIKICQWLIDRKVKMIVIACNTATAAGLEMAQQMFDIPIIGVVEPGARAAVRATHNRRVGVIATKGTVDSGVYTRAIRNIDAGITVFSTATPRFVEIAELGIRMAKGPIESYTSLASKVYIRPEFQAIAQDYLDPLRRSEIDTLVLGCTHFPLLKTLIGGVIGSHVRLISSATEVSLDCKDLLERRESLAHPGHVPTYHFASSDADVTEFASFGERVLRMPLGEVEFAPIP
ncbi:MAG: glutamate racemase [Eggerthellaceae bacterium]